MSSVIVAKVVVKAPSEELRSFLGREIFLSPALDKLIRGRQAKGSKKDILIRLSPTDEAISEADETRSLQKKLFAPLLYKGAEEGIGQKDLHIIISSDVSEMHGLVNGASLNVQVIPTAHLTRVVIITHTLADYVLGKDPSFERFLYENVKYGFKGSLLSTPFRFSESPVIAHCEPVMQGSISSEFTHFVISGPDDEISHVLQSARKIDKPQSQKTPSQRGAPLITKPQYERTFAMQPILSTSPFLRILTPYITTETSLPTEHVLSSMTGQSRANKFWQHNYHATEKSTRLKVIPLYSPLDGSLSESINRDIFSEIGVCFDILRRLSLTDGSWVEIKSKSRTRAARIRFARDSCDIDSVLVNPVLMFSLQLKEGDDVSLNWLSGLTEPPFATEAILSSIAVPNQPPPHVIDRSLKEYFVKPRCLSIGDVIPVPIVKHPSFHSDEIEEDEEDKEENVFETSSEDIFYFRLTQASPANQPYVLLSKTSCNLVLKDTVNGFIPTNVPAYVFGQELASYPPALEQPFRKLSSILSPLFETYAKKLGLSGSILVYGAKGSGKKLLASSIAKYFGMNFIEADCYDLVSINEQKTEANITKIFNRASKLGPSILLLRKAHALGKSINDSPQDKGNEPRISAFLLKCMSECSSYDHPVILIATTRMLSDVAVSVRACFRHELEIHTPDEKGRKDILQYLCRNVPLAGDISLSDISRKTAGMVGQDLHTLIAHATNIMLRRVPTIAAENDIQEESVFYSGVEITLSDMENSISFMQSHQSAKIGAPKIPNVTWDDVGGLASVKKEILDTVQLPLSHPELFGSGLKQRSGVLLFGPPGTGKTLLAKAVATECSLNFLSVKGPELINMYVGESEKNVRDVFQKAYDARPCVIFFDELDSLAPNRGKGADSGGVMDRIVSQLLAELDGLQSSNSVFVIGATNRPDLIDPALLRPGRFDRLLYLGISSDRESQLRIVEALTRKFRLEQGTNLANVIERCPFTFTGADFYALCSDSLLQSIKRKIETLEKKRLSENSSLNVSDYLNTLSETELSVQVNEDDFLEALKGVKPSVTERDLEHYRKVQMQYCPSGTSNAQNSKTRK